MPVPHTLRNKIPSDLIVNSLKVVNNSGTVVAEITPAEYGSYGQFFLYNNKGGTAKVQMFALNSGTISIFSKNEVALSLGSDQNSDGQIILFDRYGSSWHQLSGKR